ncbi:GNAT family N-acetyltransferase [Pseudarthrobacter sp. NamE2]|uniref:GNAT family N-acetyltransferase n=1 Tax=Pseudarthrobacter sp. NamE2 TaxID=2576838 RepID=UPI0010FD9DF0|nr:GNAT family N-acetyltransferase [Pseudarthrobacter sp. NamE2]TLM86348.1 GNAT family N-acetyltransferase [Pseudarthrobacter sp. NamE2]
MDAAWPAPDRQAVDGWVFRAADGVTQRANSIWPRRDPEGAAGFPGLLRGARSWYQSHRLPVIFQVMDGARTASLNAFLDTEGFTRQSETLVMTRGIWTAAASACAPGPGCFAELSPSPSAEWLQLWWSVDGRGGDPALATARGILEACPSLYALVRDSARRPAAVGRLAVPDGGTARWGGIYCMPTRPDARRRGYGSKVLQVLLEAGAGQKLDGYWLLVTAANRGAQQLYLQAGFAEASRYCYRQDPPRRALAGC